MQTIYYSRLHGIPEKKISNIIDLFYYSIIIFCNLISFFALDRPLRLFTRLIILINTPNLQYHQVLPTVTTPCCFYRYPIVHFFRILDHSILHPPSTAYSSGPLFFPGFSTGTLRTTFPSARQTPFRLEILSNV